MRYITNQAVFIFFTALFLYLIYLLAPILTPFLLGALLAYLTDPLVKKLEQWHIPHLLSVVIVFSWLILVFLLLILMLYPLIQAQISALLEFIPKAINLLQETVLPKLKNFINVDALKTTISGNLSKAGWLFGAVVSSGYTIIQAIVNLALTAVVTFYLLRDWDKVVAAIKNLIPHSIKPTVIKLAHQCDEVLGAFFRGQLLVMISLSVIYGIGLTLIGLQVGLVIGIVGGLLSIVPYLGSLFVVVTASLAALVQFGTWNALLAVLIVYAIGQIIEGYVLTPYLIGERIGLHPVAVIFAIMAGGALFGFFGVLLALPVAAIIMVLLRYVNHHYHSSKFYKQKA